MLTPTSPNKLKNVQDVKKELTNWRDFYNSKIATQVSEPDSQVSCSGLAWLSAVDSNQPMISISEAPDDTICIVMGFLCYRDLVLGLGMASRRLHALAKHPALWRSFNLAHLVKTSQLPVASRFCRIDRLFSKIEIENFWIRQVTERRITPVELELQTCNVSRRSMHQILAATASIRTLDLSYCANVDDDLLGEVRESPCCSPKNEAVVLGHAVRHGEESLRSLRLSFCSTFTPEALLSITMKASWLRKVDVSGCDQLSANDFRQLLESSLTLCSLTCNATKVTGDSFKDLPPLALTQFHAAMTKLEDRCLATIGGACPKLNDIVISSCTCISNTGVLDLVKGLRSSEHGTTPLISFVADGCFQLSDSALVPLISASPELKRLGLDRSKISTNTVEMALQRPHIERISIANCLHLMRDLPRNPQLRRELSSRRSVLDKSCKHIV